MDEKYILLALAAWLRGIAFATGKEDRRFESRQGERVFRASHVHFDAVSL
jgi:hypothetical protein